MRDNINGVVTPKQTVTGQLAMADHVGGTRNYNDLENKPSVEGVELVGDKTLEELNINSYLSNYPSESRVIQIVNTAIGQIAIPVNTSDLVNDSDFQTGDDVIDAIAGAISGLDIPTRTSDLINDSNYQTSDDVDGAIDKALEDLEIPTKTSDLTNDSDYQTGNDVDATIQSAISELDIPTKTSDLTNDSGFQTANDVDTAIGTAISGLDIPEKVSDLTNDSGYQTAANVSDAINTAVGQLDIPTKVSDLTNDSGFQTASDVQSAIAAADIPTKLSDLTNDMTFQTLTEITNLINDAIGSAVGLNFEVVQTLPATGEGGTIYLVPNGGSAVVKNVYDEYIWYNGAWEKIGSTEIDLTGYIRSGATYQNNKALMTDASGNAVTGDTTATELGYVHGVTSAIQTQINSKVDKHQTDGVDDRLMTAAEGTKLGGIASGAEENVIVGVQKNGVDLTVDANRKVNVTVPTATSDLTNDSDFVSDANYVHTDNNYDATAKGIVDGVTAALADKVDKINGKGLSTEDYTTAEKTKLASLQNYDDTALSGRITAIEGVIPSGATSSNKLATASDVSGKQDTITGAATTITDTDLTASKALVSDANGKVAVSDTTATELSYVHGVTSDIQTQLNSKASTSDLSDKQDTMQFSTMPTASPDNVGDIVQFIGATTASYTTGYFYKCVEESGSYSWVQTDVQPSSGGSGDVSQSEIAPVESTSTASKAYAVGDLFIYDGKLYRVTAAIASGGTITPNTNCVETSVSEVFVRKTGDTMSGGLTLPDITIGSRNSNGTVGTNSFSSGNNNTASGNYSHAEGLNNTASGLHSHAEGFSNTASARYTHAEGTETQATANGAHAEGNSTQAIGYQAHAEGISTIADANAHAEGGYTHAYGPYSHTEGYYTATTLQGENGHAEGYYTQAKALAAHAEGSYTVAGSAYQHVQGKYNDNKSVNAFEIGNGTADNARSNALEVTWDGDVIASGDITDGQGNTLKGSNSNLAPIEPTTTASQAYGVGDYLVYGGQLYKVTAAIASGGTIVTSGVSANVEATTVTDELGGGNSLPSGGTTGQVLTKHSNADDDVEWTTPSSADPIYLNVTTNAATPVAASAANDSVAIGYGANSQTSVQSVAIGCNSNIPSYNHYSVALGYAAKTNGSNSVAIGYNVNSTYNSVVIGYNTKTNGQNAILIGANAFAQNSSAVVIGTSAVSNNSGSIAIGSSANVAEYGSVSIGHASKSVGGASVAIGRGTNAYKYGSIAIGEYADATNNAAIAIGAADISASATYTQANKRGAIAIGSAACASGDYSTALGFGSKATSANMIQLGSTGLSSLKCQVSLTVVSDIRDKTNIESIPNAIDFLNEIEPITYVSNMRSLYEYDYMEEVQNEDGLTEIIDHNPYKDYGFTPYDKEEHAKGTKKGERRRSGVSAQNVREAMIKIYGTDNYANLINDDMYDRENVPEEVESHLGVQYECFVPFLIKAIQELDARVKELEGRT